MEGSNGEHVATGTSGAAANVVAPRDVGAMAPRCSSTAHWRRSAQTSWQTAGQVCSHACSSLTWATWRQSVCREPLGSVSTGSSNSVASVCFPRPRSAGVDPDFNLCIGDEPRSARRWQPVQKPIVPINLFSNALTLGHRAWLLADCEVGFPKRALRRGEIGRPLPAVPGREGPGAARH